MCGIFGFLVPENSALTARSVEGLLNDLFLLSETRGKESAGLHVYLPTQREGFTLKGPLRASDLIETKAYADICAKTIEKQFARSDNAPLIVIAHSRLVTNGAADQPENNQPVLRGGATVIHNGIVVNVDKMWKASPHLTRTAEVDTEILAATVGHMMQSGVSSEEATRYIYATLKGSASIAWVHERASCLSLATNTGDLYTYKDRKSGYFVFASERYILNKALEGLGCSPEERQDINWLEPGYGIRVSAHGQQEGFSLTRSPADKVEVTPLLATECTQHQFATAKATILTEPPNERLLRYNEERMRTLRRCSCCVLPETFPFIEFDNNGKCNYCRSYQPRYKGRLPDNSKARFIERLSSYRRGGRDPDCLVAFSGGRDSSYGLHLIKREFDLTPITFTYDWGMVTDLARRNIARICGELGIQNILVSADIKSKRDNIRMNVSAWLKSPDLGIVPLFMAGDKHFFRIVNQLKRQTGVALDLWCANPLENTDFKSGFCGVAPDFEKSRVDFLSFQRKLQMVGYYASRFIRNPAYINRSMVDTFGAFTSYYFEPRRDFYFIFDHFPWEEREVNSTLISTYDWEIAPDTQSTWRIGDGTAPFYNYIYLTACGFSEFDTFRSNQIREGMITREEALSNILVENRPRPASIRWYLDTIGLDFNSTIARINELDTLRLHRD